MKWGVMYTFANRWVVYEVKTGVVSTSHYFEWSARRKAQWMNERGV